MSGIFKASNFSLVSSANNGINEKYVDPAVQDESILIIAGGGGGGGSDDTAYASDSFYTGGNGGSGNETTISTGTVKDGEDAKNRLK